MSAAQIAILIASNVALSGASAAVLAFALRRRLPNAALLALACLPAVAVLAKEDVRTFSYHGLMHVSLVYRLLAGPLPPSDPFFAGTPLTYPWAHHAAVAVLVRSLGMSPFLAFALVNLALLGATVVVLYRTAAVLFADRTARVLAVVPALFGLSAFSRGPLYWAVAATTGFWSVNRVLPFEKFVHVTTNSSGVFFFALALLGMVRLARAEGRVALRPCLLLFGGVLGAALFYPAAWGSVVVSAAVSGGALLLRWGPRAGLPSLLWAGGAVAAATALAAPYLWLIQTGRNPAAALTWTPTLGWLAWKTAKVGVTLLLLAMLSFLFRRELARAVRAAPGPALVVATTATVNLALYIALQAPYGNEYKFLLLGAQTLGLAAGLPLACLYRRSLAAWALAVTLFLLPASSHTLELLQRRFGDPRTIVTRGWLARQTSPSRDRLNAWIREHTPPDAVFVDSEPSIPPFAHRSLFALLDWNLVPLADSDAPRGWSLLPSNMLHNMFGHPLPEVKRRYELTLALLARGAPRPTDVELEEILDAAGADEVYVVVRDARAQRSFDGDSRFERVFHEWPVSVHALRRARPGEPSAAPAASR